MTKNTQRIIIAISSIIGVIIGLMDLFDILHITPLGTIFFAIFTLINGVALYIVLRKDDD